MIDAARGTGLFSLEGRVFVVTGASSGIGLEIARGFAAAGATVGLNGRNPDRLAGRCAEIPNSFALPFDVTDLVAAGAAIDKVVADHGRLDGLVCNAAARDRRALTDVDTDAFRALVETNLVAAYHLARAAALHMRPRGRGRIILLASLAGNFAREGDIAYPATKAGVTGLVRSMAVELGRDGITVNAIAPGPVASEMNLPLTSDPEFSAMIDRNIPLRRWAQPAELAGAAMFLASDAGSYVTGQVIYVDGGASVKMFS